MGKFKGNMVRSNSVATITGPAGVTSSLLTTQEPGALVEGAK